MTFSRSANWPVRALLAALLVPFAFGLVAVTYRDALVQHLPGKIAEVEALRAGRLPFVFDAASCGEPLAGDPNYQAFLPELLLFLVMPARWAFCAHFAITAALAYAGVRRWIRAEGGERAAAETAAAAFVASGVFVSAWTFFNSGTALAVVPWLLAAIVKLVRRARAGDARGARRAAVEAGLWGALELMAGEPVIAVLAALLAALRALAMFAAHGTARERTSSVGPLALATALALALAAPQLAATWQSASGSSRVVERYSYEAVTSTSAAPQRALEILTPFPFGRPDIRGAGGFDRHDLFGGFAPYLWSLHLSWAALALLLLHARPFDRRERWWWVLVAVALALSLGRNLPGATWLSPLLSVGNRLRFPVKWWYVAALAILPPLAHAVTRWSDGSRPPRTHRLAVVLLGVAGFAATAMTTRFSDPAGFMILAIDIAAAAFVFWTAMRVGARPAWAMPVVVLASGLLALAPLFGAIVDRLPAAAPTAIEGRVFERAAIDVHPLPGTAGAAPESTRDLFRRAVPEMWAMAGGIDGVRYAFNRDPDGSFSVNDHIFREAVDQVPWTARVTELRLAGVTRVVSAERLPDPYRDLGPLADGRVHLYALDGTTPEVRLVTRVWHAPDVNTALAMHQDAGFDPRIDAVVPGRGPSPGPATAARVEVRESFPDVLATGTASDAPALLVWSRTYFPAWRATVDGVPAPLVPAEGHLLGVAVPSGTHTVRIWWPKAPVVTGLAIALAALVLAIALRNR